MQAGSECIEVEQPLNKPAVDFVIPSSIHVHVVNTRPEDERGAEEPRAFP